jgi:hypothetical protein
MIGKTESCRCWRCSRLPGGLRRRGRQFAGTPFRWAAARVAGGSGTGTQAVDLVLVLSGTTWPTPAPRPSRWPRPPRWTPTATHQQRAGHAERGQRRHPHARRHHHRRRRQDRRPRSASGPTARTAPSRSPPARAAIERKAAFGAVDSSGTAPSVRNGAGAEFGQHRQQRHQTVTATATALDAKRNVLPGVAIALTVNATVITPNGTTTDASGTVTGSIGIGSDRTNRTITVTATAGSLVRRPRCW